MQRWPRIPLVSRAIVLAALTCFLAQRPVQAAITLDAGFDSGSLKSYSTVRGTINLVGRDSYAGSSNRLGDGHWRWLYFKASGVQGLNLTFSIQGEFAGDGPCCDDPTTETDHELYDHEMVYSYDGVNWNFFPHGNNTLSTSSPNPNNDLFTFSLGAPFTSDEVYVAYALPYAYSRTVEHTQAVLASPWGAPTASANANGVIGQSPAGVDDIGRNIPALDLFAYRITNPATDSAAPKRKVMLATGQHAAETLGIYTYEGLANWLISDDPRAAALRDQAEFLCYPTLNASGRYAGLTRSMLQWPDTDSNGFWYPNPVSGNDYVSPERTEQRINGEAMRADKDATPGVIVDLFLDLHSSVPDYAIAGPNGEGSGGRDDWGYITNSPMAFNDPWWLALQQLQPNLLQETSNTTGGSKTLTGFALGQLNAEMSVTLENQFAISRPLSYYHAYGKNIGLAMYEAWVRVDDPLAADFDEDGDVDGNDLAAWRLGYGQTTGAEHYQGDANGDGTVDGADFLVWQQQYAAATTAANLSVPEPAAAVLLVVLSTMIASIRTRPTRPPTVLAGAVPRPRSYGPTG